MFSKLVALSVLAIWLGLIGLGYAASDNLDTYIVPSIVALDSQDYGDVVDSYRAIDLAILPALFVSNLPELVLDRTVPNFAKVSQDLSKPFEWNCSLLL
jgi:hypothetical protein